ncbi:MAG: DUF2791 family P-loop domain-containing protein, partial [Planctomycetes bacterium]|nr:DUF2791 family P-loop domain-containing protein [Planctomycetota bacterium]
MLCSSCAQENRQGATFCDSCGARLGEPQADVQGPSGIGTGLSADFVGRQREMGALVAALDDVLSEKGRLVMLVGEPGIGKTRTAEEFAAHAQQQGSLVFWGRCHEQQGIPPEGQGFKLYAPTFEVANLSS